MLATETQTAPTSATLFPFLSCLVLQVLATDRDTGLPNTISYSLIFPVLSCRCWPQTETQTAPTSATVLPFLSCLVLQVLATDRDTDRPNTISYCLIFPVLSCLAGVGHRPRHRPPQQHQLLSYLSCLVLSCRCWPQTETQTAPTTSATLLPFLSCLVLQVLATDRDTDRPNTISYYLIFPILSCRCWPQTATQTAPTTSATVLPFLSCLVLQVLATDRDTDRPNTISYSLTFPVLSCRCWPQTETQTAPTTSATVLPFLPCLAGVGHRPRHRPPQQHQLLSYLSCLVLSCRCWPQTATQTAPTTSATPCKATAPNLPTSTSASTPSRVSCTSSSRWTATPRTADPTTSLLWWLGMNRTSRGSLVMRQWRCCRQTSTITGPPLMLPNCRELWMNTPCQVWESSGLSLLCKSLASHLCVCVFVHECMLTRVCLCLCVCVCVIRSFY